MLGGPACGKGTQCAKIVEEFKFEHLSTGDLLRAEKEKGGQLGESLTEIMNAGKLVPSDLTVKLVQNAIIERGLDKTYLLDGFPRN